MSHINALTLEARVYEARPYDTFRSYAPQLPIYAQGTGTGEKDAQAIMDSFMAILPILMSPPFMNFYSALFGKETNTGR